MARQTGFTLIEIAIVLVIIGILIVGVLQGTEMIENSKTKSIIQDMRGVAAAYNSYIDRYRAPPGNEVAGIVGAGGTRGWTNTLSGSGNGIFTAPAANTFTNAAGEGGAFWQALYASGFLSGNAASIGTNLLPKHRGGGTIGIASGAVYGLSGVFVCASNLSGKQAGAIDLAIDGPTPVGTFGNNTKMIARAMAE